MGSIIGYTKGVLLILVAVCRSIPILWVWLKINQEGLRRVWSMFPLPWFDFGTGFLSHSHIKSSA